MRHAKLACKLSRTGSHRRCMLANMLKSLIVHGRIETSVAKAKVLRRHADRLITCAKKNTLDTKRRAIAKLMIRFNRLTPKEKRQAKNGDFSSYNDDRIVINKLFGEIKDRFVDRKGGYTRIIKKECRVGDASPQCFIEYVE
jgi:large subunit ribosomal protein L17